MRVAAVALVLIVGAAVVLAFANTLNSWVLGGLLGGLAAILLSIPISLALFTLLARRHDARQSAEEESFVSEEDYLDEIDDQPVIYDADGYALPLNEEFEPRRGPVSGYLALPPIEQEDDWAADESELFARREPRNYPRQPRQPRLVARSLAQEGEASPLPPSPDARRHPSTRSLAQHQSAALRQARQEARQQRLAHRPASDSLSRRTQEYSSPSRRPRPSRQLPTPETYARRLEDEYGARRSRPQGTRPSWPVDEAFSEELSTEQLPTNYRQSPRQGSYPRNPRTAHSRAVDPWTGGLEDEEEWYEDAQGRSLTRRSRRDPERTSGTLRNPLVRRAPYLYDDDPLRAELSQQLDPDWPITRRSSLYDRYEGENEY
jgi:hypothetical protein